MESFIPKDIVKSNEHLGREHLRRHSSLRDTSRNKQNGRVMRSLTERNSGKKSLPEIMVVREAGCKCLAVAPRSNGSWKWTG